MANWRVLRRHCICGLRRNIKVTTYSRPTQKVLESSYSGAFFMDSINKDGQKNKYAEREEEILKFWAENRIFEKTLERNKDSKKEFIF